MKLQQQIIFVFVFSILFFCVVAIKSSAQSNDINTLLQQSAELIGNQRFADAEKLVRKAIKLSPLNADAHNFLGIILDQSGKTIEAEREYRSAIRMNPKVVSPRANLGVLLAKNQHEAEAIKTFEAVLKLNPNHSQTIINLGLLYFSTGDFKNSVNLLKRAALLQADSFDIYLKLGIALLQINQPEEAGNSFVTAMLLVPANAEPVYYLGLIAFNRGQDENAGTYLKKAVELNPNHVAANFMLGELLSKYQRYAEAKDFYQKVLQLDSTKPAHHIRLGGMYIFLSDFNSALRIFQKAAAQFPKIPEIQYFLAIAARGIGNNGLAQISLQKALLLQPNYVDALALSGALSFDGGDFAIAEKLFRQAILINNQHFNANYDFAKLLIKTNRSAEALPFLQIAAKIKPNNPDVHYQLFLIFSRLKQKADADREFKIYKQLTENEAGQIKKQM